MHSSGYGSDSGETLRSAVVGLALVTLAFVVTGAAVTASAGVAERIAGATSMSAELAGFDALLLSSCGRIRQPLFIDALDAELRDWPAPSLRLGYLDGDPGSSLRVERSADGVVVRVGTATHRFALLDLLSVSVVVGRVPVVEAVVSDRVGGEYCVTAPVGRIPLAAVTW